MRNLSQHLLSVDTLGSHIATESDCEKHNKATGKGCKLDAEKTDNDEGAKDTEDSSPNSGEEESSSGSDSGGSKEQSSDQSDDAERHEEDAEAVASLVAVMEMGQATQGAEKDDAKTQDDGESYLMGFCAFLNKVRFCTTHSCSAELYLQHCQCDLAHHSHKHCTVAATTDMLSV